MRPEPVLIRPALREERNYVMDSRRWHGYRPRADDIIIATYSKCGTTWVQHIVCMLIFKSAEPRSIFDLAIWPDFRLALPEGAIWPIAEAQTHRRFLKSHLSLNGLPLYETIKYIHVARDGRDAALSLHNHLSNFTPIALALGDRVAQSDPLLADTFPRTGPDARAFFHDWVRDDQFGGKEGLSYFEVEPSYWRERKRDNFLLVHYADLKADRAAEMRRIADFLEIEIAPASWPALVEAAGFEAMKRNGPVLLPSASAIWEGGSQTFLHRGVNGRWQDLFDPDDLALYAEKCRTQFPPDLRRWLERGRHGAGDPALSDDKRA